MLQAAGNVSALRLKSSNNLIGSETSNFVQSQERRAISWESAVVSRTSDCDKQRRKSAKVDVTIWLNFTEGAALSPPQSPGGVK
jgi:hypothetical protein